MTSLVTRVLSLRCSEDEMDIDKKLPDKVNRIIFALMTIGTVVILLFCNEAYCLEEASGIVADIREATFSERASSGERTTGLPHLGHTAGQTTRFLESLVSMPLLILSWIITGRCMRSAFSRSRSRGQFYYEFYVVDYSR